jgi:hypothetical protein
VVDRYPVPRGVDPTVPSIARVYDVFLGGKDNFAVDREVAAAVALIHPNGAAMGTLNRAFLGRVVRYMADELGIDQFLDLGSGLPTQGNVHQIAHQVNPSARVVYVDNDAMVLAHARALLSDDRTTTVVTADIRQPAQLLQRAEVRAFIDLSKPVGILAFAILHHFVDEEHPVEIMATLRDAVPSGSLMALSHFYNPGRQNPQAAQEAERVEALFTAKLGTGRFRTQREIMAMFGDWPLVEPGLVQPAEWRPEPTDPPAEKTLTYHTVVGGVARKP